MTYIRVAVCYLQDEAEEVAATRGDQVNKLHFVQSI